MAQVKKNERRAAILSSASRLFREKGYLGCRMEEIASALAQRCPREVDASGGVARVLRTGEPELASDAHGSGLERLAADGEHLALYRKLGARSIMIVPLIARGKTIGALTFDVEHMTAAAGEAGTWATDVAEWLVARGVPAVTITTSDPSARP